METRVLEIDPLEDCRSIYKEAAAVLAEGGLVAIPTETVYGLGADAFNPEAVAQVFAVKERPSFDPLICHLSSAKALKDIADIPAALQELVNKLAKEFWPGPMTLVLPKKDCVPDIVTSGLPTVACRVTSHEAMRGVAKALGHPVAAPSANRFGHISPTSAGSRSWAVPFRWCWMQEPVPRAWRARFWLPVWMKRASPPCIFCARVP